VVLVQGFKKGDVDMEIPKRKKTKRSKDKNVLKLKPFEIYLSEHVKFHILRKNEEGKNQVRKLPRSSRRQ
jgi:hypothetical protein